MWNYLFKRSDSDLWYSHSAQCRRDCFLWPTFCFLFLVECDSVKEAFFSKFIQFGGRKRVIRETKLKSYILLLARLFFIYVLIFFIVTFCYLHQVENDIKQTHQSVTEGCRKINTRILLKLYSEDQLSVYRWIIPPCPCSLCLFCLSQYVYICCCFLTLHLTPMIVN